ncbi:MAG: FtsQ-type POTRA domain-containing protein [Pyrinomonadaceae bacterium]|nr:FtsQ-type POTRA domain-containing protein [Acidobacteriota bacterium]MBP7376213.1 FtsQ-type POTRA domain-containing protein [Pyrinomonadaceae bacterium]
MAKAKKSTIRKTRATSTKKRSSSVKPRRRGSSFDASRFILPVFVGIILLAGIGFFGVMGYRTAIASEFFNVRRVEVRGNDRVNPEDVKRIVTANTEKSGVWRADLGEIREKIEKLPFVKTASVSMVLPVGIRVGITERIPAAIVRLSYGDSLVDTEGNVVVPVTKPEPAFPFAMRGWDETKTEKAMTDNLARLKLYKKMTEEWREYGLSDRVKEVDLRDLKDPNATIEDSGRMIAVVLSRDSLGKSLKSAVEAVAGKGERVKSVNAGGVSPVLEYLSF